MTDVAMADDPRGWRIALVPDELLNVPGGDRIGILPDVLCILEAHGYGLLQLPPVGNHGLLLAMIADQIAEYAHHGYAVVAIGAPGTLGDGLHWRRLAPLLRHRGVALPPRHHIDRKGAIADEDRRLSAFLAAYDLPEAEQRRWRV